MKRETLMSDFVFFTIVNMLVSSFLASLLPLGLAFDGILTHDQLQAHIEANYVPEWKHHDAPAGLVEVMSKLDERLIVRLPFGPIQGVFSPPHYIPDETQNGTKRSTETPDPTWARAYLGIPFAEKPLGERRFRHPRKWTRSWWRAFGRRVLRAEKFGPQCMQIIAIPPKSVSEDCLYLNVFTPSFERMQELKRQGIEKLPVMMWNYGGAFEFGSAGAGAAHQWNPYVGTFVTKHKDVIIVSYNHRVGVFGFLNSNSTDSDLNPGTEDVRAAYRWIVDNIGYFGGEADNITVFGLSSGAYNALALGLDVNLPPVKRVISMSPPLSLRPKTQEESLVVSSAFMKLSKCKTVKCLRRAPGVWILLNSALSRKGWFETVLGDPLKWMPVYDGGFNRDRPLELIANPDQRLRKRLESMEFMLGATLDEASLFIQLAENIKNGAYLVLKGNQSFVDFFLQWRERRILDQLARRVSISTLSSDDRHYLHSVLHLFRGNETLVEEILRYYPPAQTHDANIRVLTQLITDYMFACPTRRFTLQVSRYVSRTYFYHLVQPSEFSRFFFKGFVGHGMDVPYFFNFAPELPPEDLAISHLYTDYWTAFASGDINQTSIPKALYPPESMKKRDGQIRFSTDDASIVGWPELSSEKHNVMTFGEPYMRSSVTNDFKVERCTFWDGVRREGVEIEYPF